MALPRRCGERLLNEHVFPLPHSSGLFFPNVEFIWFKFNLNPGLLRPHRRHNLVLEIVWVNDWGCFHLDVQTVSVFLEHFW